MSNQNQDISDYILDRVHSEPQKNPVEWRREGVRAAYGWARKYLEQDYEEQRTDPEGLEILQNVVRPVFENYHRLNENELPDLDYMDSLPQATVYEAEHFSNKFDFSPEKIAAWKFQEELENSYSQDEFDSIACIDFSASPFSLVAADYFEVEDPYFFRYSHWDEDDNEVIPLEPERDIDAEELLLIDDLKYTGQTMHEVFSYLENNSDAGITAVTGMDKDRVKNVRVMDLQEIPIKKRRATG